MDIQPPLDIFTELAMLFRVGSKFHEVNMIHCDIEPENIILHNGKLTLIDLGGLGEIGVAVREYAPAFVVSAIKVARVDCLALRL